ncbi:uncharacterized protein LOC142338441 isoform X2 [Convolutriloba macropyga]|uniref:uncharacterized protein LOC142338441 isoform X2 n=1 Tax=Convolutriloba macropyga TaxID=536237 RepID=UPI003F5232D9
MEKSMFDADCLGSNKLSELAQSSTSDGAYQNRTVVRRKVQIPAENSDHELGLSSRQESSTQLPVLHLSSVPQSLQSDSQSTHLSSSGGDLQNVFVQDFISSQHTDSMKFGADEDAINRWQEQFRSMFNSFDQSSSSEDSQLIPNLNPSFVPRNMPSVFSPQRLQQPLPRNAENWAEQFLRSSENQEKLFENAWQEAASEAEEEEWQNILKKYEEQQLNNLSELESVWVTEGDEEEAVLRGQRHPFVANRYTFQEDNPFEGVDDPLEKGIERLRFGDIPNAVLLLEEAVKHSEDKERAWYYLGVAQTENENDEAAIKALNNALNSNERNLEALMALSASYTNEGDMNRAVETLEIWLRANPAYSSIPQLPGAPQNSGLTSMSSLFMFQYKAQELLKLFEQALAISPQDLNVLTALGILNCVRNDYETAANVFRKCVGLDPKNAVLWNRLGACLANGDHSEEAISAYRNALNLRPGYIRARFNLGVACQNLQSHREAIEHFLIALNMQTQGSGPNGETSESSSAIWTNMINSVHKIGAYHDLSHSVANRDLKALSFHFGVNS